MRLKRVEVSNFRSVENATISFEPRCRILIGKNEVGKTNLLNACALLDPAFAVVPTDLRETRDQEKPVIKGYVRFVFGLSADELKAAKLSLREKVLGGDNFLCANGEKLVTPEDFLNEFHEWLYVVALPTGERNYSYWAKTGWVLQPGWLIPKSDIDSTLVIKTKQGKDVPIASLFVAHESSVPDGDKQYFIKPVLSTLNDRWSRIVDKIAKPLLPKCMLWKYSETSLLPQKINIDSFKSDPSMCEPLRAMFVLAGEKEPGEAISRAQARTNGVKKLLTRVARITTAHVKNRWKELGGIEVVLSPDGDQIEAAVKDTYNEYAFDRRSEGFKRFVSFLIMVSARSAANDFSQVVFIQDEPDLGLHPSGIKSLLKELVDLSKNNYVLISSHSIFMVDKERIDRHLVVKKNNESTTIENADRSAIQDEEVLFNALGYSLFELLRPHNLVFEGWRDKRLFQTQLKRNGGAEKFIRGKLKSEIGLTHAMGLNDIPKVITYFDAMDRKSFVISDSDAIGVEKQRSITAQKPDLEWKRYDELLGIVKPLTAEDFIKPVKLKATFISLLAERGLILTIPVDLFSRVHESGVVQTINQFLSSNGIVDTVARKELVNTWKSLIFDALESDDIEPEYAPVCKSIAMEFGYEPT